MSFKCRLPGYKGSINSDPDAHPSSRRKLYLQLFKISLLLLLWSFFTVLLIGAPINEFRTSVVTVLPKKTLVRHLHESTHVVEVSLRGPIDEKLTKFPTNKKTLPAVGVRLECLDSVSNQTRHRTDMWNVYLDDKDLDKIVKVSHLFIIPNSAESDTYGAVTLEGKFEYPVALIMITDTSPMVTNYGIIYAVFLVVGLYIIIFFELTDPTLAVLLMATTGLAVLACLGERPGLPLITTWVNIKIIILLLCLMIISGIASESGIFDWLAIQTYRISMGRKWLMVFFLAIVTALLSTLLPNATIVFVMSPIAVILSEVIPLQTPLILFVVILYANIGGALTVMGDPLNMIIAAKTDVKLFDFTAHMFPGVLGVLLVSLPVIYLTMRGNLHRLQDRQILVSAKREEARPQRNREIAEQAAWLRENHKLRRRIRPADNYFFTLAYLQTHYGLNDKLLLAKSVVVVLFLQIGFVFNEHPFLPGASLHTVATMGAILLIILAKLDDLQSVLNYLDWSAVIFLGAHFVLASVVHELGLVPWLGEKMFNVISSVERHNQTTVAILLVVWLTALLAALINNIAVTEMSVGLIKDLAMNKEINVSLSPLIWALSYGVSFGANGSLLGAHANLMGVVVARRFGYQITFMQFFRYGFPMMLVSLTIASAYLIYYSTL